MRVLDDMCDMLEDELKQIAKKDDITPQELDNAYKAVDIIKDIETIKAMKKADEGYSNNYSNRGPYYGSYDYDDMSYARDYSRDYSNEYSRARGGRDGDGDGRYNESRARGGYSRHDDKGQLMQKIEEMQRKLDKMS
jgi:hypothetical protein